MPTASTFTRVTSIPQLLAPAMSVGAHLAAKLQLFHTDERTLTDELCDMVCIWLGIAAVKTSLLPHRFTLTLSKTTAAEEVKTGADLELIVSTPVGLKRCLIQAKVLDPVSGRLRCDSAKGWKKLRQQLLAARREVSDLAFLMVYVPAGFLDGRNYGYSTYEQGVTLTPRGATPAYYGATLIPVDALLGPKGRWRNAKWKVPQIGPGQFAGAIALWRFLMELLLCRRSSWSTADELPASTGLAAFRTLAVTAGDVPPDAWRAIEAHADQWLPPDDAVNAGGDQL